MISFMDTNLSVEASASPKRLRYQHHPLSFKLALVEQSLQPGASVARLAREHGINANQLFTWRKAYREGQLGKQALLPVTVTPQETDTVPAASTPARLLLENRGARLIIEGRPDPEVLGQLLTALLP